MPPFKTPLKERQAALLVRLTLKLADRMDGIDVSRTRAGELIELSEPDAALLIAEGWAERINGNGNGNEHRMAEDAPTRAGRDTNG